MKLKEQLQLTLLKIKYQYINQDQLKCCYYIFNYYKKSKIKLVKVKNSVRIVLKMKYNKYLKNH